MFQVPTVFLILTGPTVSHASARHAISLASFQVGCLRNCKILAQTYTVHIQT